MQLAFRTARTFWLKRTAKCRRCGPPRLPPGLPPGVTVFANATINNQHHNNASHHECKNTPTFTAFGAGQARHRDAAAGAHAAKR